MTNSETKNFSQNVSSSYHLEDRCKCNKNTCANTCNVPKLRFKGYNDEWVEKRIEKVLKIKHGKDQKAIENNDGIYPILATSGEIGRSNTFLWDKPCVLIGRKGTINKPQYMDTPFWTVDTLFYSDVFQNNNAKYLYYLFNTINWKKYDESTGVPSLSAKTIERIKIKISNNLREQEKIASFLTLIDKKIEKQKELVELLKKYKRGLLSAIFSQKMRFKDDNGNNYPAWEEKRLGDICKIVGGGTPDTNNVKYWGDDINWFTPTEIIKKYADSSNRKISRLGLLKSSAKILPIGTVLLTTRATLGEMSILSIEATTNQGFQSLIPVKDEASSEFIYYCQPIIKHFCYKYANGSTFLEISKQTLAKLKLMIPNKDEQNKISDFLSKFDNKIQQEECILSNLKTYKKGLLQQMFI